MGKISIFISYDYDNDKHYKRLLTAWDSNDLFNFSFYDESVDVSVNSTDAYYIKRVIKFRIDGVTHFLCLVGEHTWKSGWIDWEIKTAFELSKKIVAVKIKNSYSSPASIYSVGASWARSFTFDSIKTAIENA